jgi:thioredoxin-related protein
MRRSLFGILCLSLAAGSLHAQVTASAKTAPAVIEDSPVKWLTFEQAVEKNKTEKKMFFIDVFTDWCGWCKVMDKSTFTEPLVAKTLNEKFYPIKFNAEQQEDVVFNGTTFKFIPYGNKGVHQLALALLNNQQSYPTVVFMDADYTMASPIPGYRKPEEFYKFLVFFSGNYYKNGQTAWQDFEKVYKSPYGDGK